MACLLQNIITGRSKIICIVKPETPTKDALAQTEGAEWDIIGKQHQDSCLTVSVFLHLQLARLLDKRKQRVERDRSTLALSQMIWITITFKLYSAKRTPQNLNVSESGLLDHSRNCFFKKETRAVSSLFYPGHLSGFHRKYGNYRLSLLTTINHH